MANARRLPAFVPAVAVVCGAALACAAPALADPLPAAPDDNAISDTRTPTLAWSGATCLEPIESATVEIVAEGIGTVATGRGESGTTTVTTPLPDDTPIRWYVKSTCLGVIQGTTPPELWRTLRVSTAPLDAPAITGGPSGLVPGGRQVFAWSGARAQAAWRVVRSDGAVAQAGEAGGSGQALVEPLPSGQYTFEVAERSLAGVSGPAATRAFTVDADVPATLALAAGPKARATTATPTFVWTGLEPGATVTWQVFGAGGAVVQGPNSVSADRVKVAPLVSGTYVFRARQADAAGNASDWLVVPFSLAVSPTASGVRLPSTNAKRLKPRAGSRVTSTRPVLRWQRKAGARLYNVQIFRVTRAGKLVKVHSAFPRARSLRVPRRVLRAGTCYVWRSWPFMAVTKPAKSAVGVSNFCVAASAK
ncbi:MAG: hypothetical protein AB7V42_05895 [Thermoleophilia bacterium]